MCLSLLTAAHAMIRLRRVMYRDFVAQNVLHTSRLFLPLKLRFCTSILSPDCNMSFVSCCMSVSILLRRFLLSDFEPFRLCVLARPVMCDVCALISVNSVLRRSRVAVWYISLCSGMVDIRDRVRGWYRTGCPWRRSSALVKFISTAVSIWSDVYDS